MTALSSLNMFGQMFVISLPVLAYLEYAGGSSRLAGVFFGAFGVAGAVIGSVWRIMPVSTPCGSHRWRLSGCRCRSSCSASCPPRRACGTRCYRDCFGPLINAPLIRGDHLPDADGAAAEGDDRRDDVRAARRGQWGW